MINVIRLLLDKFGLNDGLTIIHHFLISVFCWWASPHIFAYLDVFWAFFITSIFMIAITYLFLQWASRKNAKGFLLYVYGKIFKEWKPAIYVALYLTIPFLFIVYYKYNYHIYDFSINKKLKYHILAISSVLLASLIWSFFMYSSGTSILDVLHIFGLRL